VCGNRFNQDEDKPQYVRRLELAIRALGYGTCTGYAEPGPDINVRDISRDARLAVEVKYRTESSLGRQGSLNLRTVRELLQRYSDPHLPLLIITNGFFSEAVMARVRDADREFPAMLIQWRDNSDDGALEYALLELFGSIQAA
jgi:hypothetical protein